MCNLNGNLLMAAATASIACLFAVPPRTQSSRALKGPAGASLTIKQLHYTRNPNNGQFPEVAHGPSRS